MVPIFMCGLVRSNFCFDMSAISFVSPLSLWPVDLATTCHGDAAGFLGLASLAGRCNGSHAHGAAGAMGSRVGSRGTRCAAGDGQVFGFHTVKPDTLTAQRNSRPTRNEKAPSGGTEGGFLVFWQPSTALKRQARPSRPVPGRLSEVSSRVDVKRMAAECGDGRV